VGDVAGVQKVGLQKGFEGGVAMTPAKVLKTLLFVAKCLIVLKKSRQCPGEAVRRNPEADAATEAFGIAEAAAEENLKCFPFDTIYSCRRAFETHITDAVLAA